MRARLSRERAAAILSYLRHFREGSSVHLKKFQRLLGLMASASAVCHLGLLHMRPLQLWLKTRVPWTAWTSGRLSIAVTCGCIEALAPWRNPDLFSRGVPLGLVTSRVVVTTDASTLGWGAVCEGMPASGRWSEPQIRWHINRLELEAVFLALKEFRAQLERQHVLIRTDNTSVVSYINRQGGIRSKALCEQAAILLLWADSRLLSIRATHIPGSWIAGRTCFQGGEFLKGNGGYTPSRFRWFGTSTGKRRWIYSLRARMHIAVVLLPVPLPAGRGRAHSALASSQALCVSSDQNIASGVMQDQGGASISDTHSPELAEPALVSRPDRAVDSPSLADSGQEGHAIPGGRLGVAPEPGTMEPSCVAASGLSEELNALQSRVIDTLTEARAPSTRRLYALKWGVFVKWCHQAHIDRLLAPCWMFWVSCNTGWIVDRYPRHWKSMWQPLPRSVPRRAVSRSEKRHGGEFS